MQRLKVGQRSRRHREIERGPAVVGLVVVAGGFVDIKPLLLKVLLVEMQFNIKL